MIYCWNSDTGQRIGHLWAGPSRRPTDYVHTFSLSPDGSILASASSDNTVRFWNATAGDPIGQHVQHDSGVEAVRFSPSGESVASIRGDRKIYFWQVPWLNWWVSTLIRSTCAYSPLSPSNRQSLLTSTRRATPCPPPQSTSTILYVNPQRRARVGPRSWCELLELIAFRPLAHAS